MKRVTLILALLLILLCGQVGAAIKYFGAADSAGLGVPAGGYWSASATGTMTAATTGDTLWCVGNSYDSLTTAYSNSKNFTFMGNDFTSRVAGLKMTITGAWVVNDWDLEAALAYNAASAKALTWSGGSLKHPGSSTEVGVTGYGIGLYMTTAAITGVTFPARELTSGDLGEFLLSGGTAVAWTFSGCTFAQDDVVHLGAASSGYARFLDCAMTGSTAESAAWLSCLSTFDVDSVAVDGCTITHPVAGNSTWDWNDVLAIRLNDNLCRSWGPGHVSKGPLWYVKASTTASRPKTVTCTNNVVRRVADTAAGSRSWLYGVDKDTGTTLTFSDNLVDSTFAAELDYVLYWPVYGDSSEIADNTVYAGAFYLGAPAVADTLEASLGVGWTFSRNTIDHSHWAPTSGPSTALTFCPSNSTLEDNTIKSGVCSHLVLLNDDGVASATWRAADNGWGASRNTFRRNTYQQLQAAQVAYGIVDKAFGNDYLSETFIAGGSTGSTCRAWFLVGDSLTVANCDITLADGGGGACAAFDDGAWSGTQAVGNRVLNCLVRGPSDYAFMSSSGNGSGWSESNNCWALAYGTRFDQDGDSMATTSFTDSLSWRMDFGGRGGISGNTDSAQGFQRVGISTTSAGQPVIARQQSGFRTPKESLESIRSIGALKNVTLSMYVTTPQDRANLKVWHFGPHPQGLSYQDRAADTLKVRSAFQ